MMTLTEPFTLDTLQISDSGAERRRGLRVRQDRPVKLFDPQSSRFFGGKTCDVSATGLRIELPAFASVRLGETVNVHVGLSSAGQTLANRRSMMPAKIVWVDRSMDGRLEAGVEFTASISAHRDAA
jgi:hypothetical protein